MPKVSALWIKSATLLPVPDMSEHLDAAEHLEQLVSSGKGKASEEDMQSSLFSQRQTSKRQQGHHHLRRMKSASCHGATKC